MVRRWQSQSINAPQIPEVHWEDIGGLQHIISELLDTIQIPLKYPELIQSGLKLSGLSSLVKWFYFSLISFFFF